MHALCLAFAQLGCCDSDEYHSLKLPAEHDLLADASIAVPGAGLTTLSWRLVIALMKNVGYRQDAVDGSDWSLLPGRMAGCTCSGRQGPAC